jgi:FAD binding domain/Berberine and berberine like
VDGVRRSDIERLRGAFEGHVVGPSDPDYDLARRVWNATADRRPGLIARCATPGDVAAALVFARERDVEIAVRGGGHSYPGFSTCDDGIVIDLSPMRAVSVDSDRRVATVDAGALLGDVDRATQRHGLVCPNGAVSHTGVAGLTLGGGMGRLMRRFGLTIDNLASVDLLTADGEIVVVSDVSQPELFWGLRGAGANFGIALAFRFRLDELRTGVAFGAAVWPAERAHDMAAVFRQWSLEVSDDLTAALSLFVASDAFGPDLAGRPVVVVSVGHLGDDDIVARDMAPLMALSPVTASFPRISYLQMQTCNDDYYAWGQRNYWKGLLLDDVGDDTITVMLDRLDVVPSPQCGFGMITMGGAVAAVDDDATAFSGRHARWWLTTEALWHASSRDDEHMSWGRESFRQLQRMAATVNYINDLGEPSEHNLRDVYGPQRYGRLVELKRTWDPTNIFHLNQNITP